MAKYPDPVYVNEFIFICKLFDPVFVIGKRIIPEIVVTESMVIAISHRTPSPVTKIYNNKTKLRQCHIFATRNSKRILNRFCLWTWVNIRDYRVFPGRVKIKWLVHNTIPVSYTHLTLPT